MIKLNRQLVLVCAFLAQGCAPSNRTSELTLQEFRTLFDTSAVPCSKKPECFCTELKTSSSLPLSYSLAQYCPLASHDESGNVFTFDTWDAAGNKVDHGTFVNGKMHGRATRWHANGKLAAQTFFNRGVENGHFINWYENGHVSYDGYYRNGKLDGQLLAYSNDGKLTKRLIYKSGKLVSKHDG